MSKRLIGLLILATAVWIVALYFLFFYDKTPRQTAQESQQQIEPLRRRLTDQQLEEIVGYIKTDFNNIDFFEPYLLKFNVEELTTQMLSSMSNLQGYTFAGYARGDKEQFILLARDKNVLKVSLDDVLDGRYLPIHITSFAVAVLDLRTGSILAIR
ncbi:hypothetical protein [Pseudothermotoga elfii]